MAEFSVILVEPKYQGNIGSVARVMKNFGFTKLVLINPPKLGGEARAMAMHGLDILKDATTMRFDDLKERFDFLIATSAITAGDSNAMRSPVLPEELKNSIDLNGRIGILFGREDKGLSNEEIASCDMLLAIPASEEYPTLNLSHSVAVILYELSGISNRGKLKKFRRANKVEKEILLKKFDMLVDSVYMEEFRRKVAKKTFKQLVGRAFISGREATSLTGVFRRAGEKDKKAEFSIHSSR